MSWIRLDDDYIYHPKFVALSANAFRLWHEGMAYCRKLLTDGLIPRAALKTFRYAKRAQVDELTTPVGDGLAPLWEIIPELGFKVHDYLAWNRSREQELKDREASKLRALNSRSVRRTHTAPTAHGARSVQNMNIGSDLQEQKTELRGAVRSLAPNDPDLAMRAGELLQNYQAWFIEVRRGARYHARPAIDFEKALELVRTWDDDARLEKLARIILTTDDDWITGTDRGFGVFASKASWADVRLAEWEAQQARTA